MLHYLIFRRKKKELKRELVEVIYTLRSYLKKLFQARVWLTHRSESLFSKCVELLLKGDKAHAALYASEVSQVRRVIGNIVTVELSLERAILRLETVKDLSEIYGILSPVSKVIDKIRGEVRGALPSTAEELMGILSSVDELINKAGEVRKVGEAEAIDYTKKVLEEAELIAKQKLKEKLEIEEALEEKKAELEAESASPTTSSFESPLLSELTETTPFEDARKLLSKVKKKHFR